MSSKSYPTTLADLNFRDPDSISLYHSIKDIRKATLSIGNRLNSVLQDASFVQNVAALYHLPLIANERCGSWYIDPNIKAGSAYFKSTDGHYGEWSFSLRRLNLQVLAIVGKYGGAIMVDSTRRGKNMPDAFSKTVPIWVAVMNRVLFPDKIYSHALQCPPAPDEPGASEVTQIESRIPGFVVAFQTLELDLQALRNALTKPIRVEWMVNNEHQAWIRTKHFSQREVDSHQLILCSASRRVIGAEVSEGGYIQGAGDDSEGWSYGLTPEIFWKHKHRILNETLKEDMPNIVQELVSNQHSMTLFDKPVLIRPTPNLFICKSQARVETAFDCIINCTETMSSNQSTFNLGCRSGKLGSRDLRDKLASVNDFAYKTFSRNNTSQIMISCDSGKDLSVGVALMLLCLYYDDGGQASSFEVSREINKTFIRKRLAWISSSMPHANPSRATLQAINSFLIERP